jgi:hypothetical protein
MSRHRKIEEEAWDEDAEDLSADHVVERFFSRQDRHADDAPRRLPRAEPRTRKRPGPVRPDSDDKPSN